MSAALEVMRRDALAHLAETARLARRYGVEPADILTAVHAAMPDMIAPDDPTVLTEASPFNVRRDEHGDWALYAGNAWIANYPPRDVTDAHNPAERRTAVDYWLASTLRPLFDGSVVTR